MPLPQTGKLSLSNVVVEFAGGLDVVPFRFSDYYLDAITGWAANTAGLPSRGQKQSISLYRGKQKYAAAIVSSAFTSVTFTNAGATGRYGPTLSQCRSAYSNWGSWVQDTSYLNMATQGIQLYTVPATGRYKITVAGAGGGSANSFGGRGLVASSVFDLTQGTKLQILVGQQGSVGTGGSTGGGGGTFVVTEANVPLIVSGGGAGVLQTLTSSLAASDASSNTTGKNSHDGSGIGGSNRTGGRGSSNGFGGGGAGFSNNGTAGASAVGFTGLGYSFLNGGIGGDTATTAFGGFGGGAGTHGNTGGGGGGGGFSGGGGGNQAINPNSGGGGGSYSSNVLNIVGFNSNMGYVTIGPITSYYTSYSSNILVSGNTASNVDLRSFSNISTNINIKTYTGLMSNLPNLIHDKDLDSNVYYGMNAVSKDLYKFILTKGGTSISYSNIYTMTSSPVSITAKGGAYAPSFMGTSNGAILIAGNNRHVIHVLELNTDKNGVSYEYSIAYSNATGVEVLPKEITGFSNDYLVACTPTNTTITSWKADFATRTFTNRTDSPIVPGKFPQTALSIIYFPVGKPMFLNDTNTSNHRIGLSDATGNSMTNFQVTQATNSLTFTWINNINVYGPGGVKGEYPYPLTVQAYNSLI